MDDSLWIFTKCRAIPFDGKSLVYAIPIKDLENEYAGKGYGDFKVQVAEIAVEVINPIRIRTQELMADKAALLQLLKDGADKANQVASKTLADVYTALGLIKNG